LQRALYEPFGISWLDGLECFASISANYCLVHKDASAKIDGPKTLATARSFDGNIIDQKIMSMVDKYVRASIDKAIV